MIHRLAIVGVGLIGGSFALALRAAGAVGEVVGIGRHRATLEHAQALGLIDVAATDLAGVRNCDFVFVATPVGQLRTVFEGLLPYLGVDAVVTDGGSTKRDVVAAARVAFGARLHQFVPGHPIAGGEKSGPIAAQGELFRGRQVILTPLPENTAATIARVEAAWTACGAKIFRMDAAEHDAVLAMVSHLPHVLAYALVDQVEHHAQRELFWRHAGSGFRDFTRIAASNPEMWRDICLANRDVLLDAIDGYAATLATIRAAIESSDGAALDATFAQARQARLDWLDWLESAA